MVLQVATIMLKCFDEVVNRRAARVANRCPPVILGFALWRKAPFGKRAGIMPHGDRTQIDEREKALVLILVGDPVPDCPEIVPERQAAGRRNSTQKSCHLTCHLWVSGYRGLLVFDLSAG